MVLASNSPRRRQLLALGGWPFEVHPADIDESQLPAELPQIYVMRLAETKARRVASFYPNYLLLAADTIVVDGSDILGKPASHIEAQSMLQRLRNHAHQVFTAIALLRPADGLLAADLCSTQVPMRNYTDGEISVYVDSGDPLDKAGAYAIQHSGFHPVESLSGCYASVMGLPICHLVRSLRLFGVTPRVDVPAACQKALDYHCPVFRTILDSR